MYEVLDDTAAQTILAIDSGDSIRRVAHQIQTPYETVRQAVNRLEDAGYVTYDDGLTIVDERVRDAALVLVDDREAIIVADVACVFESVDGLSHCLVGCVEVLGDTADGVTTLDGEDSLCCRVVKHLIHLVVTNNPVTVKSLTRRRG